MIMPWKCLIFLVLVFVKLNSCILAVLCYLLHVDFNFLILLYQSTELARISDPVF